VGSDSFRQLIEIWQTLRQAPATLKQWYAERWNRIAREGKQAAYESIKASYNARPNAADLLFISRACYGGVVRFRQADGYISTPCGIHDPIPPASFNARVDEWYRRTMGTTFIHQEYEEAMNAAQEGDMIYCDPPYSYSQSILYGAHSFDLAHLFEIIAGCKARGVFVALSIDGTKKSGNTVCDITIPAGLFEHEAMVSVGRSMLRRFQRNGETLEDEVVADRLLLTY
jgi:DNA adenine methylase